MSVVAVALLLAGAAGGYSYKTHEYELSFDDPASTGIRNTNARDVIAESIAYRFTSLGGIQLPTESHEFSDAEKQLILERVASKARALKNKGVITSQDIGEVTSEYYLIRNGG